MNPMTIPDLVQTYLADDHDVKTVEFMDHLFERLPEWGHVRCTLANDHCLRFEVPGRPACDVDLGYARAKIRMLCARLGGICFELLGREDLFYGGEAVVRRTIRPDGQITCRLRFKNTPAQQEFELALQPEAPGR
jgi:hypothetical protein